MNRDVQVNSPGNISEDQLEEKLTFYPFSIVLRFHPFIKGRRTIQMYEVVSHDYEVNNLGNHQT